MQRLLAATQNTQLGAIIRAAYGLERDTTPRFCGKGIMTSDGYIMCNFIDSNNSFHPGAFVGSKADFDRNVLGVALHCKLAPAERAMFHNTMNDWAGVKLSMVDVINRGSP